MRNRPPGCKAYERGDQWFCDRCGFVWDLNDEDPPECKTTIPVIQGDKSPGFHDHGTINKEVEPDPEIEKKEVDKMRDILKPECCRHGVPVTAKCRSCDIMDHKRRNKES